MFAAVKHKIKALAIRGVNAIGISSKHYGTPKAIMNTHEWVAQFGLRYGASFQELIPASVVYQKAPLTLDAQVHKLFLDEYEFQQWPAFVAKIPCARVWGKNCAVVTPNDILLEDVSREFGAYGGVMGKEHSINKQLTLNKCTPINHIAAVIGCAGSNTYHHWLYDVIPRIYLLKLAGVFQEIEYFIVDYKGLPFQKESLKTFGIAEEQIICASEVWKFHLEAHVLYVPSLPARLGVTSTWVVNFLRESFLKEKKPTSVRLYLSRKKAPSRKLINEKEVLEFLRPKGFIEFFAEDYSMQETASFFAAADFIVGVHGAGFSNCAYLSPGAKILDIVAPKHVDGNFWILTNYAKGNFGYIFGKGERPSEDMDLIANKIDEDIEVDMQQLKEMFDKLEKSAKNY